MTTMNKEEVEEILEEDDVSINTTIDLRDLKKQKKKIRKIYKKAIKKRDYNKIQGCLKFITTYDEIAHQYKYEKYYNMLSPEIKEVLRIREEMVALKEFDTSIYDLFEEKLVGRMSANMNKMFEKRIHQMKREMLGHKRVIGNKNKNRVRHPSKR